MTRHLRGRHTLHHYGRIGEPTGYKDAFNGNIEIGDVVLVGNLERPVVHTHYLRQSMYRVFLGDFLYYYDKKDLLIVKKWYSVEPEFYEQFGLMVKSCDDRYWED